MQTPTLAIVVEREEKIRKFVPRDYWEVHRHVSAPKPASTTGSWFDAKFKKRRRRSASAAPSACGTRPRRAGDRRRVRGKPGIVTEEAKPTTQIAPLLYDLTSLQREANGRFGFSARTTLSLAQALYEQHKVLTYPRTDSRALPEDYLGTVKATLRGCSARRNALRHVRAQDPRQQKWVKPNKRIFDNAKISDHFAIIPTLQAPKHLTEAEAKLYDLVVKRFLAVFYPAGRVPGDDAHHARRRRSRSRPKARCWSSRAGSRSTARTRRRERRDAATCVAGRQPGEQRRATEKVDVDALTTRPPPRYTEGDAAVGDGRRGQADRGRRTARGDAREGPRHAGHARADHRRPDQREVHAARRARADRRPPRRFR